MHHHHNHDVCYIKHKLDLHKYVHDGANYFYLVDNLHCPTNNH